MKNYSYRSSLENILGGVGERIQRTFPSLFLVLLGAIYCMVPPTLIGLWPNLFLPAFYFWIIFIPERISFSLVMAISLVHDIYTGLPLGFHGFIYGVFHLIVSWRARKLLESTLIPLWIAFGVFVFCVVGVGQLIVMLFERGTSNFLEVQFHTLITFVVAPFVYLAINPLLHKMKL